MNETEIIETAAARPLPSQPEEPAAPSESEGKVMSLVDHLDELRHRLVVCVIALVVGTAVAFVFSPRVVELLVRPIPAGRVVFTELGGAFFLQLKLALMIGFALALPVVLYQLWAFVAPGLTARERTLARPWIPLTIVFFLLGVTVAYLILPYTAAFLLGFQIPGVLEPLITAENYFGFVTTMFLAFGVVMQFPIVLVLLDKLGIISPERLKSARRVVLLGIMVFAVVATPGGDPVSPLAMGGVMYLLYELTIALLDRSHRRREADG
ncbi:MAG TPA: twin-arginine translocase subunit TatC [Candidatus Limnocylindrales bacterium]|nr:twin-arginine translocase subunit TatC [Candidatus Limnocylindrales bacterium]